MKKHPWKFYRAGGFDQVRLDSAADLAALGELDQKLWVALSCPAAGLEIDPRTLTLLDPDGDKHIRAKDIVDACRWTVERLARPDDMLKGVDGLAVGAIKADTEAGAALAAAARAVARSLGRDEGTTLTVKEATEGLKSFQKTAFNGDGVVPPDSARDDATKAALADAIACMGGEPDVSGAEGLSGPRAEAFFKALAAHAAWLAEGDSKQGIKPLGEATAAASEAVAKVRVKVDDFFARCRLAAFDARALAALNREETAYLEIAAKDMTITADEVAGFPLERIEAGKALSLTQGVNPAWAAALAALKEKAVEPLLGKKDQLTEAEWGTLKEKLAAYDAWKATQAGAEVAKLGRARVEALVKGGAKDAILALIAEDKAQEKVAQGFGDVERLVRYHRDLYRLTNNFVTFRDFYGRKDKAIFQAGTLFIDQRSLDLCLEVTDAGKHAANAARSGIYLLYCDCVRGNPPEKKSIVAAMTAGDSDHLMVGKNGVFYDRKGLDWDATVVRIVDNPISIGQAFWSPYKKVVRFVEAQIAARAAAADTAANEGLTAKVGEVGAAAATGKGPEKKPGFDVGVVAALGVAVSGLTAALGAMLQAFFGLGIWMPLGVLALVLGVSGPSMLIAALKLRGRNIGPLLDANGWAVNAAALLNIPFGASLTQEAVLPPGSTRELTDPFAEEPTTWKRYVFMVLAVVLAWSWFLGKLDRWLPVRLRYATVTAPKAPEAPAAPAPGAPPAPAPAPAATGP